VAELRRENPEVFSILTENKEKPLGEWLQTMTALQFPPIAPQIDYLSCEPISLEQSDDSRFHESGEVVAQNLCIRLAMLEDEGGVRQLVGEVFGVQLTSRSLVNVFSFEESNAVESLSESDLEILDRCAQPDYHLISSLVRYGRIPSTYEAQMDTYFAETAARLQLKCA
jgi:hypothetical protein